MLAISDTHRAERCVHSVDLVATTGSQTQVREILGNQILDPADRANVAGQSTSSSAVGGSLDAEEFGIVTAARHQLLVAADLGDV